MKARLFCKTGILSGTQHEISHEATIGKNAGNTIVLETPIVSGSHARIYFDKNENAYFLEDLDSHNGTRLDGERVTQKEKLDKLHVITFAENFEFIFQLVEAGLAAEPKAEKPLAGAAPTAPEMKAQAAPSRPGDRTFAGDEAVAPPQPSAREKARSRPLPGSDSQKTAIGDNLGGRPSPSGAGETQKTLPEGAGISKTMLGDAPLGAPDFEAKKPGEPELDRPASRPGATPIFFLEVKSAGKDPQIFELKNGENLVGRSSQECDLCIDDASLSRRHAVLTVGTGRALLKDLGSKNRTFVNRKAIDAEVEIGLDAKIHFGMVEAQLVQKGGG